VPGHDFLSLMVPASYPPPSALLAYVGFGPGQEFIPYFLALLTVVGAALGAVVRWPFAVLVRLLGGFKRRPSGEEACAPVSANGPGPAEEGLSRSPAGDRGGSPP
jgi:hypothetical protein